MTGVHFDRNQICIYRFATKQYYRRDVLRRFLGGISLLRGGIKLEVIMDYGSAFESLECVHLQ